MLPEMSEVVRYVFILNNDATFGLNHHIAKEMRNPDGSNYLLGLYGHFRLELLISWEPVKQYDSSGGKTLMKSVEEFRNSVASSNYANPELMFLESPTIDGLIMKMQTALENQRNFEWFAGEDFAAEMNDAIEKLVASI
jgi:hypothetical protein